MKTLNNYLLKHTRGFSTKRAARSKPVREVSFHPALAQYPVKDFLPIQQESDPSLKIKAISQNSDCLSAIKALKDNSNSIYRNALLITGTAAGDDLDSFSGILTERDIMRKAVPLVWDKDENTPLAKHLGEVPIKDIMTKNLVTIADEGSLDEAVELLFKGDFRHLPVLKGEKGKSAPVGLLGINDTLQELFRVQVLHKYHKAVKEPLKTVTNASNEKFTVVAADDDVEKVAKKMNENDVGAVIVKDSLTKEVVGMFTEHDFTYGVILKDFRKSDKVKVQQVMTPVSNVVFLDSEKSILSGLETLVSTKHRHIPLLGTSEGEFPIHKETSSKVIGMLSSKHIVRYVYEV